MGKFKMPTVKEFLKRKRIYDRKKDPVWVFLEQEMQIKAKQGVKPYNQKVGNWLVFLRDLRRYFFLESKKKYRMLEKDVGPPWYFELSMKHRKILSELSASIREDAMDRVPNRMKKALRSLGISTKFPSYMLIGACENCMDDPGLFFWLLFQYYYGESPSTLLPEYDLNAMLMMSAIAFIDLEECIYEMDKICRTFEVVEPVAPEKEPPKYFEPKVKLGVYLQKMYVPYYGGASKKPKERTRLDVKIKVHSTESYEAIRMENEPVAMQNRRQRKQKALLIDRDCTYKFWEAPALLRNTSPSQAELVYKERMYKRRAKKSFLKWIPLFETVQIQLGTVSFSGGRPVYQLLNIVNVPTGYVIHNGGLVRVQTGELVITICGSYLYPKRVVTKCQPHCDCLSKWQKAVFQYLENTKCREHHRYDFYKEREICDTYVYPPTKNASYWIDRAKVFQMDPWEDFIKKDIARALRTDTSIEESSSAVGGLKPKQLLQAFLAQLSNSALLLPHLPKAHMMVNLQEWVRKRIYGKKIKPNMHKKMLLESQRKWADLNHIDFKAKAYRIPCTQKEMSKFSFHHRTLLQTMFQVLLEDFTQRNRVKLVQQSRLWWSTMKYDIYNGKSFLDVFFTYMPGRLQDVHILNPYSSNQILKPTKTCPLSKIEEKLF